MENTIDDWHRSTRREAVMLNDLIGTESAIKFCQKKLYQFDDRFSELTIHCPKLEKILSHLREMENEPAA